MTTTNREENYTAASVIDIVVTFNRLVNVFGSWGLGLNSRGSATYTSGSGTPALTFSYVVGASDDASDLDASMAGAITFSDSVSTIKDSTNVDASLVLPAPESTNIVAGQKNIVIDTTAPTIVSFTKTAGQASLANATPVRFTITFSEAIDPVSFSGSDLANTGTANSETWPVSSTDNIS